MPTRAQGKSRGYVALEALVSFPWGFSLKQQKPLALSRGGHGPEHIRAWLRKRGSDSQGRPCSVARSWELAVFFF